MSNYFAVLYFSLSSRCIVTHRVPEEVLRHLPPLKQVSGVQGRALAGIVVVVVMLEVGQPQEPRTTIRGPTTAEELASTTVKSSERPTQQPPTHLSSATESGAGEAPSRHVTTPTSLTLTPSAALSCTKHQLVANMSESQNDFEPREVKWQ